jgi:hypothetical protein
MYYTTLRCHLTTANAGLNVSRTIRKALDNDPGKGLTSEVTNGATAESVQPSWNGLGLLHIPD